MTPAQILIVDDDDLTRTAIATYLQQQGYQITRVPDGPSALRLIKKEPVTLLITDLKLPGMDGFEILTRALAHQSRLACIVITGYGTIDDAVKAMKLGAIDFLTKPIQLEQVGIVVHKALSYQTLQHEHLLLKKSVQETYQLDKLIGHSEDIRQVHEFVEKVADDDDCTVLILGESGTGKELVVRMLHYTSIRQDHALVAINCAAIPDTMLEAELFGHERGAFSGALTTRIGRFELAHGGTLFLDEIGEMPLALQAKLLRVLQHRSFERLGGHKTIHVDVRVLAATNQDLEQAVHDGRFRRDLYYRLNVFPITVPPLRNRITDLPFLIEHFLAKANTTKHTSVTGFSPEALDALQRYAWPGNVRELENLIERLVLLHRTGELGLTQLPSPFHHLPPPSPAMAASTIPFPPDGLNLEEEVDRFETSLILEALRHSHGVVTKAAQLLQMNRSTLAERLKKKQLAPKPQGTLF